MSTQLTLSIYELIIESYELIIALYAVLINETDETKKAEYRAIISNIRSELDVLNDVLEEIAKNAE